MIFVLLLNLIYCLPRKGIVITKNRSFIYLQESHKKEDFILYLTSTSNVQFDLYSNSSLILTWNGTELKKQIRMDKFLVYKFKYSTNQSAKLFIKEEDQNAPVIYSYEDILTFIMVTVALSLVAFMCITLVFVLCVFIICFCRNIINWLDKKNCNFGLLDLIRKQRERQVRKDVDVYHSIN
jgi:hypothetical protein